MEKTKSVAWDHQSHHLSAIEAYEQYQWSVLPLNAKKEPFFSWKKYQTQRPSSEEITQWERQYGVSSYAVITGAVSGLVILDFDGEQGRQTLEKLGLTPHVKTGSNGRHCYFFHPGWYVPTLNSKSKEELGRRWPGLDIRADGGYAAFCGSNTKGSYEWLRDPEPDSLDLLPEALRDFLGLLHAPTTNNQNWTLPTGDVLVDRALQKIGMGMGRNDAGYWLASQLRDNKFTKTEAESLMLDYQRRTPSTNTKGQMEAYTDQDALKTLRSAYSGFSRDAWSGTPRSNEQYQDYRPSPPPASNGNGHQETPTSFNLTDLGNAERFASRYTDTVRWCETWNTWIIFNGKFWETDRSGRVDQMAKATVRAIYHEVANEPDKQARDALVKHAKASESNRAIRAMLDRAKSELPATPEEFNRHLYLLNCNNGTLDLQTGELHPHSSGDMLTRCLKINYNPLAPYTKWEAFIASIFANNADLITFIQQALGMSLAGDMSEQCLFICHGNGSNGKTTMLEIVRIILASYALAANIETFQVRKGERINNDVAELYGARFVTAEENTLGSRLNEAFIKKATGKQPLRARRLHENEFEFMPEFTIWFAVNHKPVVKDTSKGMWRRVHFIPFNVTFEGDKINKHLGDELLAEEAEGILAWLVSGCHAWIKQGHLVPPTDVVEATKAYQDEMDIIGRYLDARCEKDEKAEVGATELYADYKRWCDETGEHWEKQKVFGDRLTEQGYTRTRVGKAKVTVYHGLRLLPPENTPGGHGGHDGHDSSRSPTRVSDASPKSVNNPVPSCPPCPPTDETESHEPVEKTLARVEAHLKQRGLKEVLWRVTAPYSFVSIAEYLQKLRACLISPNPSLQYDANEEVQRQFS